MAADNPAATNMWCTGVVVTGLARLRWCLTACAALALSALGATVSADPVFPSTPQGYVPRADVAENDKPAVYTNGCHQSLTATVPVVCTNGSPGVSATTAGGSRTVALVGDSHAVHWMDAFLGIARLRQWRFLSITKTHCPAETLTVSVYLGRDRYGQCNTWRAGVIEGIAEQRWGHIDVLVLSSSASHVVYPSMRGPLLPVTDRTSAYAAGLRRTLTAVADHVGEVVVLRDNPDLPGGRTSFNDCMRKNVTNANSCGGYARKVTNRAIAAAERAVIAQFTNVRMVDLTADLCPQGYCLTVINGVRVYRDDNHFTRAFMWRTMMPKLRPVLIDVMERATTPPPI